MVSEKVRVRNVTGLHLRPATELSNICSQCPCGVTIIHPKGRINPKSVLMLMSAAIKAGTEIEVQCSGEDEENSLKKITDAIKGGFGEEMID
ncbi:MAG TPA: HPr family phosphocarrier protein [Ruminococcaceae bacterium]|mgnify:FL=1|jgi:phosphocarrier protein|nr:HPr family phosphocarrier protein [Oscillospiraceae bacterium]